MANRARVHRVRYLFTRANWWIGNDGGELATLQRVIDVAMENGRAVGGEAKGLGVLPAAVERSVVYVDERDAAGFILIGKDEPYRADSASEIEDFASKIGLGEGFKQQSATIIKAILRKDP